MAFCMNCGQQLPDGAKFCANCGTATGTVKSEGIQRKTVYDGEIHKCPNCGEILNSFVSTCPSCGYEIRNTRVSTSIREFAENVIKAETEAQKITLIRNFPIPNTKEDIYEYMILASSNLTESMDADVFEAWRAKFEQGFQKANYLLKEDTAALTELQLLYDKTSKKIHRLRANKQVKAAGTAAGKTLGHFFRHNAHALPNMIICAAWVISIFVLIPLCKDYDYQIFLFFDFIAGAILIPYATKSNSSVPKLIVVVGLAISIAVLIPLCKGSYGPDYQIMLFFDIIATTIIAVRMFKKAKSNTKA